MLKDTARWPPLSQAVPLSRKVTSQFLLNTFLDLGSPLAVYSAFANVREEFLSPCAFPVAFVAMLLS